MAAAEHLITANLDIWSSTVKTKSATGRGSSKKLELYGIKKLRELILELAVRGLLVPQDPNDEPASELLKRITTEKAKLVKEGKIKKQNALPPIEEGEKPFVLPEGWEWARFPEVCDYGPGKTPSTKNPVYWGDYGSGYPWVSIADMTHYETLMETAKCISQEAADTVFKSGPVKAGTLLMSFKLTVGKTSKLGIDAYHNEAIISIRPYKGVSQDYIYRFLPSRALAGNTKQAIMGATLNSKSLAKLLIPIPPEKEQPRIVAKVDELMALCDQLEQQQETSITAHQTLVQTLLDALTTASERDGFTAAWARIADHFDTLFTTEWSIDQLKKTILQLAVMGKLVPQDPNDEPASELLKRITTEKAKLVKEGKIKKQNALPPIEEGEKPFVLPEGWEWARLNEMVTQLGDGLHGTPQYDENGTYFFVNGNNLRDGAIIIKPETKRVNEEEFQKYRKNINGRTVLVSINGTLGNVAFYKNEAVVLGKSACYFNLGGGLSKQFMKLLIESPYYLGYAFENATGSTIKNLGLKAMNAFPVAMPPRHEQNRIAAKVDELMVLCDSLKSRVNTAQNTQFQLADAMADHAVG